MTLEMIAIQDALAEARVRIRALSLASAGLEDDDERDALQELSRLAAQPIAAAEALVSKVRNGTTTC